MPEIVFDRLAHGERTGGLRLVPQRRLLCLRETEYGLAIAIGIIIGHALERRHGVGLAADVTTNAPRARPARQPAVAEVQSGLDQSPVRPTADPEPGARLAAA